MTPSCPRRAVEVVCSKIYTLNAATLSCDIVISIKSTSGPWRVGKLEFCHIPVVIGATEQVYNDYLENTIQVLVA